MLWPDSGVGKNAARVSAKAVSVVGMERQGEERDRDIVSTPKVGIGSPVGLRPILTRLQPHKRPPVRVYPGPYRIGFLDGYSGRPFCCLPRVVIISVSSSRNAG